MGFLSLVTCALALACHPTLGSEPNPPPQQATILEHVTVIDVAGGSALADRSVVIAGGRITALGRAGEVAAPAVAKVVNATGKYAIPG